MSVVESNSALMRRVLMDVVDECIRQGPGFAQETVVLREASEKLGLAGSLAEQQRLLTVWNDLFREGVLAWGYNIDNPTAPFFHKARR